MAIDASILKVVVIKLINIGSHREEVNQYQEAEVQAKAEGYLQIKFTGTHTPFTHPFINSLSRTGPNT